MNTIQIWYEGLSPSCMGDAVSGQVETLLCRFAFDEAWETYPIRYAVFSDKAEVYPPVLLDGEDKAYAPAKALADRKWLNIGVVGIRINEDGKPLRYNGRPCRVIVDQGNIVPVPEETEASIYEQLLLTVNNLAETKLDANQGAANAGRVLTVGEDGVVRPGELPATDATLTQTGKAADAKAVGDALAKQSKAIADKANKAGWTPNKYIGTDEEGNLTEKDAPTGGGTGTGSNGWSNEEITLLETILKSAVTSSDQTANIDALVKMLQSGSSGNEGTGGDNTNETYTVTLNLTNVIPSNMSNTAVSGDVYVNVLTVGDGYALGTPVITMCGYDVTAQYYDGAGTISISVVQGDIEITCKALKVDTLNMIPTGSEYPDPTTFEYAESYVGQYVVASGNTIPGGILSIDWDTSAVEGGPALIIYLLKDGEPYKISKGTNSPGGELDIEWQDPGTIGRVRIDAPWTLKIPDGCTCLLALNRNTLSNESVNNNATAAQWILDNFIITVTEME